LVSELARSGIRHACVCPGSRSTPLVAALVKEPAIRVWSHLDERSAGFFGVGLARASGRPVALVCTSGTAAANFLPAVVEASQARVPLVVLTADRPPELRGWGAGQTIDQIHLYGSHVRWFVEAPTPEARPELLRYARALAARLVASARQRPQGPVHANFPFREPLEPAPVAGDVAPDLEARDPLAARGRSTGPFTAGVEGTRRADEDLVERLAQRVRAHPRGVLLCGPLDVEPEFASWCVRLARAAGWPVLADALSPLRCGPHTKEAPLLETFDTLLRVERFAAEHAPQMVLRFGDAPTSNSVRLWLERHPAAQQILIDPDAVWHDPSHLASEILRVEPSSLASALAHRLENDGGVPRTEWLEEFAAADCTARAALDQGIEEERSFLEPELVRVLADTLPEHATLFASNSMPVRDVDAFLPVTSKRVRVMGQRGANGIDGILSAALGASVGAEGPLVLLTGDLALLHDLGGLLAARRHGLKLTVVVVNNDGGGIFSFLPSARFPEELDFTEQFTTPHGLDLGRVAQLFGLVHARIGSAHHLRQELERALDGSCSTLLEIPIDRQASVAHHRRLWADVERVLSGAGAER
jgi:2-succinyl-5-enolpyruvyl-6-hydroxy-3-cyclohexene-1-carboxylate synthase